MAEGAFDDGFPETRWTLIQRARGREREGLEEWCRGYWRPVRDYIQAQGVSADEAGELAQQFFEKFMEKGAERMLPEKLSGVFRAYLKRSVKNFLTDVWRSRKTEKRGGGQELLEVNDELLEYGGVSPDVAFEQGWVLTLLDRASANLEKEMEESGKGRFFGKVVGLLDGRDETVDREALASELEMTVGGFRAALYRLRQRFRHLVEEELRETVGTREEFEEEVRYLLTVWS